MELALLLLAIPAACGVGICHVLMSPKSASKYATINFFRCFIGQAVLLTFVGYGSPGIFMVVVPWWLALIFGWKDALISTTLLAICFGFFALVSFMYAKQFSTRQEAKNG
jgi:hypothetical protein